MKKTIILALVVFAAGYVFSWLSERAGAQQQPSSSDILTEFYIPDSIRPRYLDNYVLHKLLLVMEGGPQTGTNWKMVAGSDGLTHLPKRLNRGKWAVQNLSTENVFYSFAPADKGVNGWEVPPGATTGGVSTADIYVWSASGTAEVRFVEGIWQ